MVIGTANFERKTWESYSIEDKTLQNNVFSRCSEVEIAEHLFKSIPCSSDLRYCVDVGTRNGESFGDDTLITHSLLVSNDMKENDERRVHETFVDNDRMYDQNTWFGVLLQPDDRAFQSLKRLHQPLGNLCLQLSPSVDERPNNDESLQRILKQHVSELPLDFDFLGLHEVGYSNYWLLRNLLASYTFRPKVVCISYDDKCPNDVVYIPDQNNEQQLPSMRALVDLMSVYDYQLAATTSRCCFFSTRELYEGYLKTGAGYSLGKMPSVSQHLSSSHGYNGHQKKQEVPRSYPHSNSYGTDPDMYSSMNRTLRENNIDKQQSFERSMTGMMEAKQSAMEFHSRPDTLGMKWLAQRRKMFESSDSKPTTIPSNHKLSSGWQTHTKSMPSGGEVEMKTNVNGMTNTMRQNEFGEQNMVEWKNSNAIAENNFESRDDLNYSPTNTSAAREDIENTTFFGRDSGNLMEGDRFRNKYTSKHFSQEMQNILPDPSGDAQRFSTRLKSFPPDPVGDTISQKIKQNHVSTSDKLEKRESMKDVEINEVPKNLNASLFELKNEFSKLSKDMEEEFTDGIPEESSYAMSESDDVFVPIILPTDLKSLCGPYKKSSEKERSECAKGLLSELQRNGHAMICGTEISRFLCRDALYASHLILYEADESVRNSCVSENGILRGYAPKCTERSSSLDLKDMVRKFRLGSEKGRTPNIWPADGSLDEETDEYIRNSLQEYHDNLHRVAVLIAKSIFQIISNDVTYPSITESYNVNDPNSTLLTVFNCERGSRHDTGKPLMTNNNDTSLLTIVLVDGGDCANIQHEMTEGEWENVRLPNVIPNDPIFMVYAGESLEQLSGGRIPSHSRRVVPCSGDQSVNGLAFSLMPSDTDVSPYLPEESTNSDPEDSVQQNPISQLESELKDIGEVFESYIFSENGDLLDPDLDISMTEKGEFTTDPFSWDAVEDSRRMRRNHIDPLRFGNKHSSASEQFQRLSSVVENEPFGIERDERSSRYNRDSSRRATFGGPFRVARDELSSSYDREYDRHYDRESSRRASFGGPEVRVHEEFAIGSVQQRAQPFRHDSPKQLLGSSELPIVIENKGTTAESTQIAKFDKNPKPNPPIPTENSVQQNRDSMNTKNFLPVASPRNLPRGDVNELENHSSKVDNSSAVKARKLFIGDRGKNDRSIASKINVRGSRSDTKDPGRKDNVPRQTFGTLLRNKRREIENSRKEMTSPKKLPSGQMIINPVGSSDASAILDEILGAASPKIQLSPKAVLSPSSETSGSIFKACRNSLTAEYNLKKILASEYNSKKIQSSAQRAQAAGANRSGKSTGNNNKSKDNHAGTLPPSPSLVGGGDKKYVPFRGSVVEWKMRENAKKIQNTSMKWQQRGYKFGSEVAKGGKIHKNEKLLSQLTQRYIESKTRSTPLV